MSNIDSVLAKSANDLVKEVEVERVLKAFKFNPYEIMDLPYGATESDVKRQFRKKSILIHPDKFKHEKGEEAFDKLKKAEEALSDKVKRAEIDSIMKHARMQVIKTILGTGFSMTVTDDDSRLQNLKPTLSAQIFLKAREILVEDEVARNRKTQVAFANEGREKAEAEAAVNERKRKADDKVKWEERREERIESWRSYQKDAAKPKKKKNAHVLG